MADGRSFNREFHTPGGPILVEGLCCTIGAIFVGVMIIAMYDVNRKYYGGVIPSNGSLMIIQYVIIPLVIGIALLALEYKDRISI